MLSSKFHNRNLIRATLLSGCAAALGFSAPAMAQVEEIVVTAQKVEENVQDVPIARQNNRRLAPSTGPS